MIVLRKQQMEALEHQAKVLFADRVAASLRREFPTQCQSLGRQKLRARILGNMNQAAQYELRTEWQLHAFVRLSFLWGDGFHASTHREWAGKILGRFDWTADQRVRRLCEYSERLRNEQAAMEKGSSSSSGKGQRGALEP